MGSYLIAGDRDNSFYSFKSKLSEIHYNSVIFMLLLTDLRNMGASTDDLSNLAHIKRQLISFIDYPKDLWPTGTYYTC